MILIIKIKKIIILQLFASINKSLIILTGIFFVELRLYVYICFVVCFLNGIIYFVTIKYMKKLFSLTILIILSINLFSQEKSQSLVKWYSFEEAVELNRVNAKKLFIDVYTDWCGWCKVMDKNTFNHPVIAKYLNENFYPVKFNAETTDTVRFGGKLFVNSGEGTRPPHQLAIALLRGQMSYPSIAYMDEQNRLLTTVPGYLTPESIEPLLKYIAEDIYKTGKSFVEYQKTFVSSIKE